MQDHTGHSAELRLPIFAYPIAGTILGLIAGSFLATILIRWPQGQSAMAGRSRCDQCGHQLRLLELVPVISYLLQSGKCRRCGTKISPDHPAIELAAGLVGGIALFAVPDITGLAGATFGWLLLALAALDAKHHWLPDRLTLLLAVTGIASSFIVNQPAIVDRLIGGIAGYSMLALIAWIYKAARGREGLGGGDPKLLGAIGCWLGWAALPFVVLGASVVGLLALAGMRSRGEDISATSALPLGSFMAVTAFPLWLVQAATGGLPL